MQLHKIDGNGYLVFDKHKYLQYGEEIPDDYITTPLPTDENGKQLPFYRPRWTGTEWVEDKSQQEIDEEKLLNSLIPTAQEIADAELTIKVYEILQIAEVIE